MAYCRFSNDCDISVYVTHDNGFKAHGSEMLCCTHWNKENVPDFTCYRYSEMLAHLVEHEVQGDKVPKKAYDKILADQKEFGDKLWKKGENR